MAIRAVIADDMMLARKRLRRHLAAHPEVEIVAEAPGGREAIDAVRAHKPDLLFLDVQMPEVGGFDVLEQLGPDAVPAVIFVTAYDQFALKAFEVHALDYLLKPFDAERLAEALARAARLIQRQATGQAAGELRSLLSELGTSEKYPRRLVIRADGRMVFLPVEDIEYVEAAGNYLRIITGSGAHMIRDKISDMEQRLDPSSFARIHRSTIVNLDRIKEMQPLFNGDQTVILRGGRKLTMSRTYREAVMKVLDRL